MLNEFKLIGRFTEAGKYLEAKDDKKSVLFFTLAVNKTFKNSKGEYDTDFFEVVTFGNNADFGKNYNKGDLVLVGGSLGLKEITTSKDDSTYQTKVVQLNATELKTILRNKNE